MKEVIVYIRTTYPKRIHELPSVFLEGLTYEIKDKDKTEEQSNDR